MPTQISAGCDFCGKSWRVWQDGEVPNGWMRGSIRGEETGWQGKRDVFVCDTCLDLLRKSAG